MDKVIPGRSYHIQMTVGFLRNAVNYNWKVVKEFSNIKNKTKVLKALDKMDEQGFEVMPCSCKKTAKNGQCLGFEG